MPESTIISPSLEDYLEVILDLKEQNESIRVTDLAERMNVAKSSVNQAVTKLVELELLEHEKYGPLELTELGMKKAQKVRERHQMLTRFFVEVLKIDPETAEKDACGMEHFISPVTMERLIEFSSKIIGNSKETDPGN
ncbi:MAG TPA: metal-dependent transcriptional regulator [Bacillota bacterium]